MKHPAQEREKARLAATQSNGKMSVVHGTGSDMPSTRKKWKIKGLNPTLMKVYSKLGKGGSPSAARKAGAKTEDTQELETGAKTGVTYDGKRFGNKDLTEPNPVAEEVASEIKPEPKPRPAKPSEIPKFGEGASPEMKAEEERFMKPEMDKLEAQRQKVLKEAEAEGTSWMPKYHPVMDPAEAAELRAEHEQARIIKAYESTSVECEGCHASCKDKVVPGVAIFGLEVKGPSDEEMPTVPELYTFFGSDGGAMSDITLESVEHRAVVSPATPEDPPPGVGDVGGLDIGSNMNSMLEVGGTDGVVLDEKIEKEDPKTAAMIAAVESSTTLAELFAALNGKPEDLEEMLGKSGLSDSQGISDVKAEHGKDDPVKIQAHRELIITAGLGDKGTMTLTHSVYMEPTRAVAMLLCGVGITQARGSVYRATAELKESTLNDVEVVGPSHREFSHMNGKLSVALHYSSAENYRLTGGLEGSGRFSVDGVTVNFENLQLSAFCGMKHGVEEEGAALNTHADLSGLFTDCTGKMRADADTGSMKVAAFGKLSIPLHRMRMTVDNGGVHMGTAGRVEKFGSSVEVEVTVDGQTVTGTAIATRPLDLNKVKAFKRAAGKAAGFLPSLDGQSRMHFSGTTLRIVDQDAHTQHSGFRAQITEAEFDFKAKTMSMKMEAADGYHFAVHTPDGSMASFEAGATHFELNNVLGAKFTGSGAVTVQSLGSMNVQFNGGFNKQGVQLMSAGEGSLGEKPVKLWLAAQTGAKTAADEFILAITFNNGVHLSEFPALSSIPDVGDFASLGKDATLAMVNMPNGGASLFKAVQADIEEDAGEKAFSWRPVTESLLSFGLNDIKEPLAGILVNADMVAYDFSGKHAVLNQFLPEGGEGRVKGVFHETSLRGYMNPSDNSYHMHLALRGGSHFKCPEVVDVDATELGVDFSQTGKDFSVNLSGTGKAKYTQVMAPKNTMPVEITGTMNDDGSVEVEAYGIIFLEGAEAKTSVKMSQKGSTVQGSVFISAPRVALQQVARVPESNSVKYLEDASIFYSNHDETISNSEILHAGMTLTGTVNIMDGDEMLKPLETLLSVDSESKGAQVRSWFPLVEQVVGETKMVHADDFVIHQTMQNEVVKTVRMPHTDHNMIVVTLTDPTVDTWADGGESHTVVHASGSLDMSGLVGATFDGAELAFMDDGSFEMSGEVDVGDDDKVPFTVRSTSARYVDMPHEINTHATKDTDTALQELESEHKKDPSVAAEFTGEASETATEKEATATTAKASTLVSTKQHHAKQAAKATADIKEEQKKQEMLKLELDKAAHDEKLRAQREKRFAQHRKTHKKMHSFFVEPAEETVLLQKLTAAHPDASGFHPDDGSDVGQHSMAPAEPNMPPGHPEALPGAEKERVLSELSPEDRDKYVSASDADKEALMKDFLDKYGALESKYADGPPTGRFGDLGVNGGSDNKFNRNVNVDTVFGKKGIDANPGAKPHSEIDSNPADHIHNPAKRVSFNTERLVVMVGPFADGSKLLPMTQSPEASEQFSSIASAFLVAANGPVDLHLPEAQAMGLPPATSLHSGLTFGAKVEIAGGSKLHVLTSEGIFDASKTYPVTMTFDKEATTVDFHLDNAPTVLSDEELGENIGRVSMNVQKAVATFMKAGEPEVFLFGDLVLSAGSLGESLTFAHTRLNLHTNGAWTLTAITIPDPVQDEMDSESDLEKYTTGSAFPDDSEAPEDVAAEAAAAQEIAKAAAKDSPKSVLLVLSKQPDLPLRSVVRIAVADEAVDSVFDKELSVVKESKSAGLMSRIFKKMARNPKNHDRLKDEGSHSHENEGVEVFLEASVLHGKPMTINFAGRSHTATEDGVSIMLHTPLSDALLDTGLPLDLGERRVLVHLDVPWAFYHDHDASHLPTMGFSGHDLGDLAYPRKLGDELTVHDFEVLLSAISATHPALQVSVLAKMDYQPAKTTEWGNEAGDTPPDVQELTLTGGLGHDAASLELSVTSKGAAKGTWASAFGEPNVALKNSKLVMRLSEQKKLDLKARGVESVIVSGDASVTIHQGKETKKMHLPAEGVMDMHKPEDSRLVCGEGDFKFIARSETVAREFSRVQLAFNINADDLKEFEMSAAKDHGVFPEDGIALLKRDLAPMGIELGKTFDITKMAPSSVVLDGSKSPFKVKYTAKYFDKKWKSGLAFTLEDMNKARHGTYDVSNGKVYTCSDDALMEIGFGYDSINSAQDKCDFEEHCKSFLLRNDGKAWFCSEAPTKTTASADFATAVLTSSDTSLMDAADMAAFVHLGMAYTFPRLMEKKFEQFGAMLGFKFTPSLSKTDDEKWLSFDVRPTAAALPELTDKLSTALLGAVKHVMLLPAGDNGGEFTMSEVTKKTLDGAIEAKIDSLKDVASDKEAELKHHLDQSILIATDQLSDSVVSLIEEDNLDSVNKKVKAAKDEFLEKFYTAEGVTPEALNDAAVAAKLAAYQTSADKMLAEAKDKMSTISEQLTTSVSSGKSSAQTVAKALQDKMPQITSVHISDIYVQCLFSATCDKSKAAEPTIKVCFTEIGCSEEEDYPGNALLQEWIMTQAKMTMVAWFRKYLEFEEVSVDYPMYIRYDTHPYSVGGGDTQYVEEAKAIETEVRAFKIPKDVKSSDLSDWQSKAAEVVPAKEIAQHNMPKGLTVDGMMADMEDKVKNPELRDTIAMRMAHDEKDGDFDKVQKAEDELAPPEDLFVEEEDLEDDVVTKNSYGDNMISPKGIEKMLAASQAQNQAKADAKAKMPKLPKPEELVATAEAAWSQEVATTFSTSAAPAGTGEDNTVQAIVDLKVYCMGAKKLMDDDEELKAGLEGEQAGPLIALINFFGDNTGKDFISEFATSIGDLEVKYNMGVGKYMLDSLNEYILGGKNPVILTDMKYQVKSEALGIEPGATYLEKLSVGAGKYAGLHAEMFKGDAGTAKDLWGKTSLTRIYQDCFDRAEAVWGRKNEMNDQKLEAAAKLAIQASVKTSESEGADGDEIPRPLPVAAIGGADAEKAESPFKMPTIEEIKAEAMAEAKKKMAEIAASGLSTIDIIKQLERELTGVTIEFTSDPHLFASSHQQPTVFIQGTLGKIEATVEALPLAGQAINRTYVADNGKTIGEIRYVVIRNDAKVKNPWLCSKFRVQVGHGTEWTELIPQGRIHGSWWLDGSNGEDGPFYGLPKKDAWLMAKPGENKHKVRRKFHHFDVGGFHVDPRDASHHEVLKGTNSKGIVDTSVQCGHEVYGDVKYGVRSSGCKTFSLCQGLHTFWDHATREWFHMSNCHDSGIDSLQQCAQKAENSGNCEMDYIQYNNGTYGKGKYCFCNPKGKHIQEKEDFDYEDDADVLYPIHYGLTDEEKAADERAEKAAPRYRFNKKLTNQDPDCRTVVDQDSHMKSDHDMAVDGCASDVTYAQMVDKCGNDDACDGFTIAHDSFNTSKLSVGCMYTHCFGYSGGSPKASHDDYYEREGFSLEDEAAEKARSKELQTKYENKKISDEKKAKRDSKQAEKDTKTRMDRDKVREIKEKWTRPYWDVANGHGTCTAVTEKFGTSGADRCALYSNQHCAVPGSTRIGEAENCNWDGSLVIKGCSYRCSRDYSLMPEGWTGPPVVSKRDDNHQKALFKDASEHDLSPWGPDGPEREKPRLAPAVHARFMTLIQSMSKDYSKACDTAKTLIKTVGIKQFKKVTGLNHMTCDDNKKMPITSKEYDIMVKNLKRMHKEHTARNAVKSPWGMLPPLH